ncbi:MAG: hypothetical protein GKR89_17700 [Candidatus Latescibacteria bacterium]|nr:hypothetical protein [Candidatus Latescibacterota bacterium]
MRYGLLVFIGALWALPAGAANTWAQLCSLRVQQAEQAGTTTVSGLGDWLFFAPELRHLAAGPFWGPNAASVSQAVRPEHADPLAAIVTFKRQLESLDIELIVLPVPPKAAVYPDSLAPLPAPPPRLDTHHATFYDLLRQQGVEVLDLTPHFLAARSTGAPLYCRTDTHWSSRACVLTAQAVAAALKPRPWVAELAQSSLSSTWGEVEITGDLRPGSETPETLPLRFVQDATAPVAPDRTSPILLLGDSHTLVFQAGGDMHAQGAGLADQLALELGRAVDLLGVRGSGSTAARVSLYRRSRSDPTYLADKKVVIWCFSARAFTQSRDGWRPVPVVP